MDANTTSRLEAPETLSFHVRSMRFEDVEAAMAVIEA